MQSNILNIENWSSYKDLPVQELLTIANKDMNDNINNI